MALNIIQGAKKNQSFAVVAGGRFHLKRYLRDHDIAQHPTASRVTGKSQSLTYKC